LDIEIWSDIPIGVGLGSSAAISVACTTALNNLFDLRLDLGGISSIAFEAEKITHGTPSGIDNTISTYGGALFYKKGKIKRIEIPIEIPLLIVNSGIARDTKTQVSNVRTLYKKYPSIIKHIFNAIDAISLKMENALRLKQIQIIAELMNYNQDFLRLLGVSSDALETLINQLKLGGASGVKLTGAGGGGCVIALLESNIVKKNCITQLQSQGFTYYDTKISEIGAKVQETLKY